ncbi:MAG: MSHA biogenesis protein MshA [Desulfuromonas sp.]|nr:MAG: MSHA biogenesis protein MshA [Desulfuromonas sp.]
MNYVMKQENGFTLIELIIVIVVLGIMSAVAIPKFIDLQDDATEATAEGIVGAINGSAELVRGAALVRGVASAGGNVLVSGSNVTVVAGGYPAATAAGIGSAVKIDSDWSGAVDTTTYVYQNASGNCTVRYSVVADATNPSFSTAIDAGCKK